jgi:4-alpha-glucanotransferase
LHDSDFAAMRRLLTASMRHAGAVRLDHVLGLMRLYFIPKGMSAKEGSYVRFPFEQLLRVVAEESNKHRCIFIGEDLGTVPEGFRETAARCGVWTYRVMMFERWQNGEFKPPQAYPIEALGAFNTHDLPTFCGWMCAGDLAIKRDIGVDPGESDEARRNAQSALRQILAPFAGPNPPDSFPAAAGFLAATPCRLVMVALEDMLDVVEQVNIPGTVDQHPNWRRKLPILLEEWPAEPTFRAVCAAFDYSGRGRRKA